MADNIKITLDAQQVAEAIGDYIKKHYNMRVVGAGRLAIQPVRAVLTVEQIKQTTPNPFISKKE